MTLSFDLYQTMGLSALALALGSLIRKRCPLFARFCIPAPVIGGLVFALLSWLLHAAWGIGLAFDDTMREVCMVFFFTCVGFRSDPGTLRSGGRPLLLFSLSIAVLIVAQNLIAAGMASLMGIPALTGLCAGSVSLVGGHGTSGAFGPILEGAGFAGATECCIAAATWGLAAGGLLGGPVGEGLIRKTGTPPDIPGDTAPAPAEGRAALLPGAGGHAAAVFQLIAAAGIGTVISRALSALGLTFPSYIGGMIAAIVMRCIDGAPGRLGIRTEELGEMSGIFLNLFLGIAMITLKLWQLAALALPLAAILTVQTVFMALYARFAVFRLLGGGYDAAVICAGICGLGLGATPTAMANMQSVCRRYKPSIQAFLIVPVVGGVILDLCNSILITLFINILR